MSLRQARGAKSHIPEIPFIRTWEYNPHQSVDCGLIDGGLRRSIGQPANTLEGYPVAPTENQPGIKITTIRRSTFRNSLGLYDSSPEPENFYLLGELRRLEHYRMFTGGPQPDGSLSRNYGPRVVSIVRPDLGQVFELNLDASEYSQRPYPPPKPQPLTKEQMAARGIKMPGHGEGVKPTFRIETVTNDTGERKETFGYTARHVIITRREIPLENSARNAQETIRDGWYIDLEPELYPNLYPVPKPKGPVHAYTSVSSHGPGEEPKIPAEKPEFVDIGQPENGFAVQETRTSGSNGFGQTSETSVTIERLVLDSGLFEVPSGFKQVSQINRNPVHSQGSHT
jgi:hypothetical protein